MSFIEVKNGIFVNTDKIEGIIDIFDENKPGIKSMVHTSNESFPSVLSAEVLMDLMARGTQPEQPDGQLLQQILNIKKTESSFMG